jgi:hypothetical protein
MNDKPPPAGGKGGGFGHAAHSTECGTAAQISQDCLSLIIRMMSHAGGPGTMFPRHLE